jgi:hypothetical protein
MKEVFLSIIIFFLIISISYFIGIFFARGLLKEIDTFLSKKFTDYVNNKTKKEEDGNKEKAE